MAKIRVLIVEDSVTYRELLKVVIGADPRLEVVAAVETAEEALECLPIVRPDVISMDIRLPGMNGFEATQRIMRSQPTPIVVCSASVEDEELKISMNALHSGALAIVEKPGGLSQSDRNELSKALCNQLAIMSKVRVIRQNSRRQLKVSPKPAPPRRDPGSVPKPEMLGIVASTGGPQALVTLLKGLPKDFPIPILLVQHMVSSFMEGFVSWLDTVCDLSVSMAHEGETPRPGKIYVAPADVHLRLRDRKLCLDKDEPICFQQPSGTALFASMAKCLGANCLGVLLTGMGRDGADGMLSLHQAGAYTIAEDATTAVVYGMPAEAVKLGAVDESLPLQAIAPRILELTGHVAPRARAV